MWLPFKNCVVVTRRCMLSVVAIKKWCLRGMDREGWRDEDNRRKETSAKKIRERERKRERDLHIAKATPEDKDVP